MSKKRLGFVSLLAVVVLVGAACQRQPAEKAPSEQKAKGGTFSVELHEPGQLDPAQSDDSEETIVTRNIFEGLVTYDSTTAATKPGVATKWEVNSDSTVWTFTLRKDAKFSNGEKVTADSFIRGWNRSTAPPTPEGEDIAPIGYHLADIAGYDDHHGTDETPGTGKGLTGLKAKDDYTLEVTLARPDPEFAIKTGHTAFFPLPSQATIDGQKPSFSEFPIGNGQFMLKGPEPWKHDQSITMIPSPNYKGGRNPSLLDEVIFKIYADLDTAYLEWQAGNLDYIRVPPTKTAEARSQYKDRLLEEPTSVLTYMGVTLKKPPMDNKKFRQALSMAINRQEIIKAIFDNSQVEARGIIPPVMPGYRKEGPCQYCKFDPAKAKQLLQESGVKVEGPIVFAFNAGAGHEQWTAAAADQIKTNLGIDVKLEAVTGFSKNFIPRLRKGEVTGLFRLGWGMDYPTPQNFLKPLFGTEAIGQDNLSEYSNKAFDDLIAKAATQEDPADRIKTYQQAEDIIVEDLPVLPMWFRISVRLANLQKWGGLQVNPFDDASIETVYLKKAAGPSS